MSEAIPTGDDAKDLHCRVAQLALQMIAELHACFIDSKYSFAMGISSVWPDPSGNVKIQLVPEFLWISQEERSKLEQAPQDWALRNMNRCFKGISSREGILELFLAQHVSHSVRCHLRWADEPSGIGKTIYAKGMASICDKLIFPVVTGINGAWPEIRWARDPLSIYPQAVPVRPGAQFLYVANASVLRQIQSIEPRTSFIDESHMKAVFQYLKQEMCNKEVKSTFEFKSACHPRAIWVLRVLTDVLQISGAQLLKMYATEDSWCLERGGVSTNSAFYEVDDCGRDYFWPNHVVPCIQFDGKVYILDPLLKAPIEESCWRTEALKVHGKVATSNLPLPFDDLGLELAMAMQIGGGVLHPYKEQ